MGVVVQTVIEGCYSGKCLYKHEELSVGPLHPHKKLDTYNLSAGEAGEGDLWACWSASLAESLSFRFSERPGFSIRWKVIEEDTKL